MQSFRDKVAAITGAGSGIGRALALELARRGCHLALSDVNEAGLAETARQAGATGVKVTTAKVDVADRAAVQAWADASAQAHGRVNLIFNNAGVAVTATVEGEYADLEWLMGINFWGVVHGTRAFLPHLRAAGEGHVINISSLFGIIALPTQSAYNAAKFAVRGYTESLHQELEMQGGAVRATCVHPGGIRTNIARAARRSDSVSSLGAVNSPDSVARFERMLRMSPDDAARVILRAVERKQRRVLVGADAWIMDWVARCFPTGYQRLTTALARRSAAESRADTPG